MRSDMQQVRLFLLKAALLASPLLLATLLYVVCDPFRVLYRYEFSNYYDEAAPVELNRDYASLQIFSKNYAQQKYDSFVFGSSRSFPIHCDSWQKYVPGARPFHYPAASENLLGIAEKVRYLDERGVALKHVLIEAHTVALADVAPRSDVTHRLPYEISGESWLDFQGAMLGGYFTDLYFVKYGEYKLTGHVRPYAKSALGIKRGSVRVDPLTNDYFFEAYERELADNEDAFYERRASQFPPHDGPAPPCSAPVIGREQEAKLAALRRIFDKQGTEFRLIISPHWDEICIHPDDLNKLHALFGDGVVSDFTGRNEISKDRRNFYDAGHVRPRVADQMLEAVYRGGQAFVGR
jgi:hypothetical protein